MQLRSPKMVWLSFDLYFSAWKDIQETARYNYTELELITSPSTPFSEVVSPPL